jgi:polar amino acid transport system substrate-binding protein
MMKTIFLYVLALLSPLAISADTLTIATYPIPLMVVSKNEGVFIELTKALAQEASLELTIIVLTPQRAFQELEAKTIDCVFPALKVIMPGDYALSDSVYVKRDYVFTLKDKEQPSLEILSDLPGKHVGITSGYPYAKTLTSDSRIHLAVANSDRQNVKKLMAGRIDAFIVEEKSGLKAFLNNGRRNEVSYNPAQPLSEQDVFYAFQKTIRGKVLAEKISAALVVLKENGMFARIMEKAQ